MVTSQGQLRLCSWVTATVVYGIFPAKFVHFNVHSTLNSEASSLSGSKFLHGPDPGLILIMVHFLGFGLCLLFTVPWPSPQSSNLDTRSHNSHSCHVTMMLYDVLSCFCRSVDPMLSWSQGWKWQRPVLESSLLFLKKKERKAKKHDFVLTSFKISSHIGLFKALG